MIIIYSNLKYIYIFDLFTNSNFNDYIIWKNF